MRELVRQSEAAMTDKMSSRTELLTIQQTLPSERLDAFLRGKFPTVSRGAIQRLIDQGHIRVDGRSVKPTHTPRAGDKSKCIGLRPAPPKPSRRQWRSKSYTKTRTCWC